MLRLWSLVIALDIFMKRYFFCKSISHNASTAASAISVIQTSLLRSVTPFTDRILAKRHLHFLSAIAKTLQIEVDAARSIVVVAAQHHRGGNCAARADLGVPTARGPHNAAGGSRDWNRRPQAAVATVVRFASFLLDVGSATSRCGAAPS